MSRSLVAVAVALAGLAGCLAQADGGDGGAEGQPAGPGGAAPAPGASRAPPAGMPWAAPEAADLRPGAYAEANGFCTSDFVFVAQDRSRAFVGLAGHCVVDEMAADTDFDACDPGMVTASPLGTAVALHGRGEPVVGRLAYSSIATMQERGESDPDTCLGNDFALVEVGAADWPRISPALQFFGGPTGLATQAPEPGTTVAAYGNSRVRDGFPVVSPALSPKVGALVGTDHGGWILQTTFQNPSIPGDSGSPVILAESGEALGIILQLGPVAYSHAGALAKMLAYLEATTDLRVDLATWDLLALPL